MLLVLLACRTDPVDPPVADDSALTRDSPVDSEPPIDSEPEVVDPPSVLINELVSNNKGSTLTPWSVASDWVELVNTGPEAVDLSGFTLSDDYTQPDKAALPEGFTLEPGEHRVLWADGHGEQPDSLPYALSADGEAVGLFTPERERIDWVQFPALGADTAWARLPDGGEDWVEIPVGTPGQANRMVELIELSLVERGAVWSFWDQGSHPGEGWNLAGFDEATWSSGGAPLGYGDSDIVTTIGYGEDSSDKHVTAWFRQEIEVPEGTLVEGTLEVQCDDGCLVWLEGQELGRRYLPEGDVDETTLASETAYGDSETEWTRFSLEAEQLTAGTVALGVEVHQVGATSSDTRMDLSLELVVLQ